MKKTLSILLITLLAALLAACPAETGTNTETNENTEEPAKTVEAAILEVDDSFTEAGKKKDVKFYEANVSDDFVGVMGNGRADKAMVLKWIGDDPCEPVSSSTSDRKVVELGDGVALMTGKGSGERKCGDKTEKNSDVYAVLWEKDGEAWKAAYYQSIDIEEKVMPADKDAKAEEGAAKEEKPAAEGEAKKEEAPVEPKIANDEEMAKTLLEIENKLWEAWSKNDIKPFEETLAANFMSLSADGVGDRAAEIKAIGEGGCKINSFSLSDGMATKVNDGLYIFTYKGMQDGTCGEEALDKVVYTTTIFTKDGDAWKPMFHMNSPEPKK